MNEPAKTPRRILLATDLSARCDRALDRGAMLARAWNAELLVLHVLEELADLYSGRLEQGLPTWRRPLDSQQLAEEQIRRDMLPLNVNFQVLVEKGEPSEAIVRTAEVHGCELVITGLARDETLGRFRIGGTVERLLKRSSVPLLVVRGRARSHYERIVVGTDFSDSSRPALQTALRLFPGQPITVFHAYDVPLVQFADDATKLQLTYGKMAAEICAEFLSTVDMPEERRRTIRQLVEPGNPRRLIHQYVRDGNIDLVVLGTHGRNVLADLFIGSTTREILASLPCDALVVPAPRP